jgi:hypothetical protein
MDVEAYLTQMEQQLLDDYNFKEISLTNDWVSGIPVEAGVYVLKEENEVIYVGETGSLRGRMKDLLDSRHHSVRRTLGHNLFSNLDGYACATVKSKFPHEIEDLLDCHIRQKVFISYIVIPLGRKELEERVERIILSAAKLNKRGKRKTGIVSKNIK